MTGGRASRPGLVRGWLARRRGHCPGSSTTLLSRDSVPSMLLAGRAAPLADASGSGVEMWLARIVPAERLVPTNRSPSSATGDEHSDCVDLAISAHGRTMPPRLKRWVVLGLLALAGLGALTAASLPYLPFIHGTTAGEVERLATWLDVKPGTRVADLGAGNGTFAIALARRVGSSGHVYATELD